MKIPDKVYIPYEIGPDYISDNYYLGPTPKMENAEYIRKDALLEWAKDLKHIYEIPVNNHQANELCLAKAKAFQIVINKIESL